MCAPGPVGVDFVTPYKCVSVDFGFIPIDFGEVDKDESAVDSACVLSLVLLLTAPFVCGVIVLVLDFYSFHLFLYYLNYFLRSIDTLNYH